MAERRKVIVIGTGVTGLAAARELARAGWEPAVFGHPGSSASRAAGFETSAIRFTHRLAIDVRDAVEAKVLWRRLEKETRTTLLVPSGSLDLGHATDATRAALDECGVQYEHIAIDNAPGAPLRSLHADEHGVFQRDGAAADSRRVREVMASDALAHGATIECYDSVTRIERCPGGVRARIGGATVAARMLVLAAGPWTTELADQLGECLPARSAVQTSVRLEHQPVETSPMPSIFERTTAGDEFRLTPCTTSGAIIATIDTNRLEGALNGDRSPDAELVKRAITWARSRLPEIGEEQARSAWIATHVPDERFHLVRNGPIVSAVSYAGRGYTFAPLVGARAAALTHEGLNS